MEKTYKISKSYKYVPKYFDLNAGVQFVKGQSENIDNYNLDLLIKYKKFLANSNSSPEVFTILNDINVFLKEISKDKEEIQKSLWKLSKGVAGEDKVKNILFSYNNEWQIIQSASFKVDGNLIENDFIVIDETGITSIEVKNIGNSKETLHIDEFGRASIIKDNEEIEIGDIISQSERHLAFLRNLISKYSNIPPIRAFIVVTSSVKINNESEFTVLAPNTIYNAIKSNDEVLTEQEVKSYYDLLLKNRIEGNKYAYIDYISNLDTNYNLILREIKEFIDKE